MEYELVVVAKGSEVGKKAAKRALKIAKENNIGTIHLLFVNDVDFFSRGSYVHLKKELEVGIENIGRVIMEKLEDVIKSSDNRIKVERIELKGKTAEEILRFVKENVVRTLIIPKEERGPIERSLIHNDIEPFFNEIKQYVNDFIVVE